MVGGLYRLRPGPVRDFGTERALAEPLGPNTGNFPSSCPRFTLLTELNLSLKARPEAHTFDFIEDCVRVLFGGRVEKRELGTRQRLGKKLFRAPVPALLWLTELNLT